MKLTECGAPIVSAQAWFCPILPKPSAEMTVVVGLPLELPRIEAPTQASRARIHLIGHTATAARTILTIFTQR